jgi:diguanylate cyclase (GGDEF)-like protein/PAS domain S-box-containing protein
MLEELANKEIPFETDYTVVTPAGLQKTIFAKGLPDKDKNGESIINGTVQDVTGIRKAQSELKEAYSKLNKYIEIIDDNVIVSETDRDGYITTVSDAFCHISGYGRNELIGKHFTFLLDGNRDDALLAKVESMLDNGQTWSGEIRHKRKDGKFYWAMVTVSPRYNASGKMEGIIAIRQDITDKKRVEELSVTDELTGLFNRRHFNNIIKNELNRAKREKNMMTFAILDVDRFKQYNDTYGHLMGDQVLQKIAASMLNRANRASDYLFRLGGEEFGIIFSGADEVQTADFLENIRKDIIDLKIPHEKNDAFRFVTISAGAVCIDFRSGIAPGIEAIYRMADEELYKSKKAGRNKTHVKIIN